MNKFSDYRATMGRFRAVGEEQKTYKESYMVLADFLTSLKKTQIDYQYFPTQQYMRDAQKYESMIKTVVIKFATSLEYGLENVPQDMARDLKVIRAAIGPAIDAAGRLGSGSVTAKDISTIVTLLSRASSFAENYGMLCAVTNDNLKNFKEDGLVELEADMKKLIDTISGGSSTYKEQKKKLMEQIRILQEIASDKTNAAIGLGVGVGIFMVLGAAAIIATIATAGAAAPALIALAGVGVPCLIGVSALGVFCAQAEAAQKQIKEITAQMEAGDVSIAQLDTYGEIYGGFVSQIDEVAKAVGIMQEEWERLADELKALSSLVEKSSASMDAGDWLELEGLLKEMDTAMKGLEMEINTMCIDKTMVSKGSYSFEMTEEEMQKECAEAEQVPLRQYLLTA